jgi:hypothetical protein
MVRENSWVVRDHMGHIHTRYGAFLVLLKNSRLFFWLYPLAVLATPMGDACYRLVANHRGVFGRGTRFLHGENVLLKQGMVSAAFCMFGFYAAMMWNIANMHSLHSSVPKWVRPFAVILRLDQYWSMFAPYPLKDDGWYVMPGKTVDGREADVWSQTIGAVNWQNQSTSMTSILISAGANI